MKKRNKFNAIKTVLDGIKFDSKKEAQRYQELKIMQRAGEIYNLQLQPVFECKVNGKKICKYIADFSYLIEGQGMIVEDVKSSFTAKQPVYRLKKKLVEALFPITITEV